ncbi:clathrin adaptor complexes medium subunit family protein [Klebsormidium nitens]|uniref:Clathrin adaptor complexes medium subunit family protein n=1 Tax=Klebsormidium nitens TaxID=105231 RepID=A0A1Y1IIC5_KLENI|nr:clathrin adaptor complexes medium subunit family protein [Klebsormidium nitens]|eukprot:GAQ88831.1 clathrin adaptor complexes medium subunit family protein [Klebsormidium nitens]
MEACALRALWILSSSSGEVCFSRKFPSVERQWRQLQSAATDAARLEKPSRSSEDGSNLQPEQPQSVQSVSPENAPNGSRPGVRTMPFVTQRLAPDHTGSVAQQSGHGKQSDGSLEIGGRIPFDAEVARCFQKHQEAMRASQGLRKLGNPAGTDAWLDDPLTQHVIGLRTDGGLLWPVVKHHAQGAFTILVLPLVDPFVVESFQALQCYESVNSSSAPKIADLSTLVLLTPAITMALAVAAALGNVLTPPPAIPPPSAPSAASLYSFGLVDSLTGFAKSGSQKGGGVPSVRTEPAGSSAGVLRKEDKDALRTFIAGAMPMGRPLDLNPSLTSALASNGFGAADVPPADLTQPYWKPYLYRGKQRLFLMVRERVTAALFDRPEVEDVVSISGEVVCRADLEGLPDVTVPLSFPRGASVRALSVHPNAQSPEPTPYGATLCLSPPLGLFTLARYQAPGRCEKAPIRGFLQIQLLSESKAAVLIRLTLMEGLRKESSLEHCTLTIPFPGRTIVSVEGTPSVGSLAPQDGSLVWRVVTPGRWFGGKTGEATLSATVLTAPGLKGPGTTMPEAGPMDYTADDVDDDATTSSASRPATWADPFAWDQYSHARVSFKVSGCSLTETAIDTSKVLIYPPAKASVEATYEVVEGDYILWNSLGKSPPLHHLPFLERHGANASSPIA